MRYELDSEDGSGIIDGSAAELLELARNLRQPSGNLRSRILWRLAQAAMKDIWQRGQSRVSVTLYHAEVADMLATAHRLGMLELCYRVDVSVSYGADCELCDQPHGCDECDELDTDADHDSTFYVWSTSVPGPDRFGIDGSEWGSLARSDVRSAGQDRNGYGICYYRDRGDDMMRLYDYVQWAEENPYTGHPNLRNIYVTVTLDSMARLDWPDSMTEAMAR